MTNASGRERSLLMRGHRRLLSFVLLAAIAGTLPGCSSQGYEVGDVGPGGGIVFFVTTEPFPCGPDLSGLCTRLEVATPGTETVRAWAPEPDPEAGTPGADRSAIGAGAINTREAVETLGEDSGLYAAAYADAYTQNGYDDWHLPSKAELFELYVQREAAGIADVGTYWSSTDYAFITAWSLDFAEGPLRRRLQMDELVVLPVRAF